MFKERAEITPEEKIEATQETKDAFLGYVIFLCHETNKGPKFISAFTLDDGTCIEVSYSDNKTMKESAAENPLQAHLVIREPGSNQGKAKLTSYNLYKNGEIEMFSSLLDLAEERRITRAILEGKELDFDLLEEANRRFAAMEEERSVGLMFVSEAELKKINRILKGLLEKLKKQKCPTSPPRIVKRLIH